MFRLLIPTRNRPTSLRHVLQYFARFHGAMRIVVADGSGDGYDEENRATVEGLKGRLDVDYRRYPADLSYADRLLDVLRGLSDEFVVMGADDDFPVVETLEEGVSFLRQNPDYATAVGAFVHLVHRPTDNLTARLRVVHSITAAKAEDRAVDYAASPFATFYAVIRKERLVERIERTKAVFVTGFYDFDNGFNDCMHGKIKALPSIGCIRTNNYGHSYVRLTDRLIFLRQANEVLQIMDRMSRDLVTHTNKDAAGAQRLAEQLIQGRIATLVTKPSERAKVAKPQHVMNDPAVQSQMEEFRAMLDAADSAPRRRFADRLKAISMSLREIARSADNEGEARKYSSLTEQAGAATSSPLGQENSTGGEPQAGAASGGGVPRPSAPPSPTASSAKARQSDKAHQAAPRSRPTAERPNESAMLARLDPDTMLRIAPSPAPAASRNPSPEESFRS